MSTTAIAEENNFSTSNSFSGPYVIIIKGVYLKNDAGEWIKVIEPDRKVDLSREEAVVTFFNNAGRVPAGSYKNFRVDFFSAGDSNSVRKLLSKDDFERVVAVGKGSFIRVAFDLKLEQSLAVEKADLTVGEDERKLLGNSLILEA